jgi:hypothetical protein
MGYGIEKEKHLGGYIVDLTDHGDPNSYATEIWDKMVDEGIKSVADIGCGQGFSTQYFLNKNIDCVGIEGGKIAFNSSPVKDHLILHDYTKGPLKIDRRFDAAWTCEFVEHVEEKYCNHFLHTFSLCDKIFMTHANVGQEGYHHVNCQPSSYWIEKLNALGFKYDNDATSMYKALSPQCLHLRNLLVFIK